MSNTPISDYQSQNACNFNSRDHVVEQSICADIEAKLATAITALEFYSNPVNWKLNGPCDGNSSNFDGWTPAKKALKEIAELQNYLPSKTA